MCLIKKFDVFKGSIINFKIWLVFEIVELLKKKKLINN